MKREIKRPGVEIVEIAQETIKHQVYIILLTRSIRYNASFYTVIVRNGKKGKEIMFDSGELTDINEAYDIYDSVKFNLKKTIGCI